MTMNPTIPDWQYPGHVATGSMNAWNSGGGIASHTHDGINSDPLADGSVNVYKIADISILGWTSALTFSATDSNTVAWTAEDITLPDERVYSIDAGNTGNMADVTYIYLDLQESETELQISTDANDSVGPDRICIAVAAPVTSGKHAKFQAFGGAGGVGVFITADNVATNTLTANEIAANTITGTEIYTMNISGKNATFDTGTIAGWTMSSSTLSNGTNIILDASNKAISIKSSTFGNSGIQMQYNAGTPRFYTGNGASQYIKFDGANVTIGGGISAGTIDIGGSDSSSFHVDSAGNMWLGAASYASAPFKVSSAGAGVATSMTVTGAITTSSGSAINADYISAGILSGRTVKSSSGNDRIELTNGDYIDFYAGGVRKGRLRATTVGGGGINVVSGDCTIDNGKSFLMKDSGGSTFGRIGIDTSNNILFVLGGADTFYMKNTAETANLFTVSASQVYAGVDFEIANGYTFNPGHNNYDQETSGSEGDLYYNTVDKVYRAYLDGGWRDIDYT